MVLRLSDVIVRGEINNTKNYSTFGQFELAGYEGPFLLELTGNCDPDLRGKRIYFEAVPLPPEPKDGPPNVAGHLIGTTGIMTAAGWVKTFDGSPEEYARRVSQGEQPPITWKRRLYLEFYCQHGRTVIDLAGPVLEYDAGDDEHEDWRPLPETKPMPTTDDEERMREQADLLGPEVIIVHDMGQAEQTDAREFLGQRKADDEAFDLQRQLDAQAAEVDRAIHGDEPVGEEDEDELDDSERKTIRELELMDYLIGHEPGDPISLIFQTPRRLPHPDEIPEAKVEPLLKSLLAEMAVCGVALHVCRHFTPRDTYRLIYEKVIDGEWTFHPQLAGTGWVQNFMTSEHCPACEADFEREYEEHETRRREAGPSGDEEDDIQ